MNSANQPPDPQRPTDDQLEERIVAWVLGEASDFEIAALQAAVAARPELAAFKRRIEAVHGLVGEAAQQDREVGRFLRNRRSESHPETGAGEGGAAQGGRFGETSLPAEAAPLRLSPDRRAKLLAVIGSASAVAGGADPGKTAAQPKAPAPSKPSAVRLPRPPARPWWRNDWFYSAAACVVISIGGFWMLGTLPKEYEQVSHVAHALKATSAEREEERAKAEELWKAAADQSERRRGLEGDEERELAVAAEDSVTWAVPSKQTRSLSVKPSMTFGMNAPAGAAPRAGWSAQPQRQVAIDSAYGYAGTTDEGSTGVLDKFEVHETEYGGYTARDTLAGTRLNTNLNLPEVRLRTELKDIASSKSNVSRREQTGSGTYKDKALAGGDTFDYYNKLSDTGGQRDSFLSKRKTERSGRKGGAPAPAAPVVGGEAEEVVVLSPFKVDASNDSGYLVSNRRAPKQPKRPDPSATTSGMGAGGLTVTSVNLGSAADQPVITVEEAPSAVDGAAVDTPLPRLAQKPRPPPTADETSAAQEPVSTFSLHVSDASFKLALAALAAGNLPDAASIRPEEFYNAFDYGDPAPGAGEKVSCRVEQSAHPFAQQRNLVRIAVRVPATGRGAGTPLNLTVLLDTSGSMERPDRRAAVRAALSTLVGLLGPNDHVTLVGFARQPRLLAEALDGNHANQTLDLLDRTPAEGGTNFEEALKLGGELARRHFAEAAQNRIVLLTDGAANLGNAEPERLAAAIETLRSQRIAFDACGVGLEGVEDEMLEALTRKGDGRYYVLDSPEAADAGFARQLAGAFRPAAENVKLQVRFNPARVGRYRLVGFEKHRLREEDFRNDAVDAAELAAEEAAVAVYEVEALPQGEGELGEVFVRFRDAASKTMVERSWTLPYESRAAAFDRASPSLQLAGTAAALAEKLRGGPAGDRVDLDALAPIVNAQRARRPDDKRIQDLATMFEQVRKMKK